MRAYKRATTMGPPTALCCPAWNSYGAPWVSNQNAIVSLAILSRSINVILYLATICRRSELAGTLVGGRWIPITETELIRALFHSLSTQNQATVVVRDHLPKDDGARGM